MTKEPRLTEEQEQEIAWTKEEIEEVPAYNWIYKVACFFIGKRRMTYEEMFLLHYGLNKNRVGPDEAKKYAVQQIIAIYEHNHGVPPEGVEKAYGTQGLDSSGE